MQNDTILPNADRPSDLQNFTPTEINQGQDVQEDASQARTTTQVPLRHSPRTQKERYPLGFDLYGIEEDSKDEKPKEHEIEKIIRSRYSKDGEPEDLIHWKGFPKEARSYEPLSNLNDAAKLYITTHNVPITGTPRNLSE